MIQGNLSTLFLVQFKVIVMRYLCVSIPYLTIQKHPVEKRCVLLNNSIVNQGVFVFLNVNSCIYLSVPLSHD